MGGESDQIKASIRSGDFLAFTNCQDYAEQHILLDLRKISRMHESSRMPGRKGEARLSIVRGWPYRARFCGRFDNGDKIVSHERRAAYQSAIDIGLLE